MSQMSQMMLKMCDSNLTIFNSSRNEIAFIQNIEKTVTFVIKLSLKSNQRSLYLKIGKFAHENWLLKKLNSILKITLHKIKGKWGKLKLKFAIVLHPEEAV